MFSGRLGRSSYNSTDTDRQAFAGAFDWQILHFCHRRERKRRVTRFKRAINEDRDPWRSPRTVFPMPASDPRSLRNGRYRLAAREH